METSLPPRPRLMLPAGAVAAVIETPKTASATSTWSCLFIRDGFPGFRASPATQGGSSPKPAPGPDGRYLFDQRIATSNRGRETYLSVRVSWLRRGHGFDSVSHRHREAAT